MREPDRFSHRDSGEDQLILLDRRHEIAALTMAIDAVSRGCGQVVPIEGPVGIGKSRLMVQARASAQASGLQVLSAWAGEPERGCAYGVVGQLVRPTLRRRALAERHPTDRLTTTPDASGQDAYEASRDLYLTLAAMTTQRPLLITVDDLHCSDRPSLQTLAHLARRIDTLPALLVVSLATDDSTPDGSLVDEIVRDVAVTLRPRPLSQHAAAHLLTHTLGAIPDPAFAAACVTATGGNPRLLTDLAQALSADSVRPQSAEVGRIAEIAPAAVAPAVLSRLRRSPNRALDVARAVCVLGDQATLVAVARLTGLSASNAARAVRTLVRAGILHPDPPLRYRLGTVRAAVDRDLSPGERELHNATAARQLCAGGVPAERVAPFLLRVDPRGEKWVVDVLDEVTRAPSSSSAAHVTVDYLRRALEEPPLPGRRTELLGRLGLAEFEIDGQSALTHLSAAYRDAEPSPDRTEVAACLGQLLVLLRSPQQGGDLVHAEAHHHCVSADRRLELAAIAAYAGHLGAVGCQVEQLPAAASGVSSVGPGTGLLLAVSAWRHALTGASADVSRSLAEAALDDRGVAAPGAVLTAVLAASVLTLTEADQAVPTWEMIIDSAVRRNASFAVQHARLWQGFDLLSRGDLVAAEHGLRAALSAADAVDWPAGRWCAAGLLARVLLERGDLVGAAGALQGCNGPAPGADADAVVSRARIELLLARGRTARAATAADRCATRLDTITNPAWLPWRSWQATARARLGRRVEALELAEEELALARRWGAPGAVAAALRRVAVLVGARGVPLARLAVDIAARSPSRLEHAKALVTLGSSLRRARCPKDARGPLRQAADLAGPIGAAPVLARALAELSAAGGRPHPPPGVGVAALTPSERRVVDLAAAGASNRDIADALYVTTKTVEVHLSHAYRKLGISARTGLPRALGADPGAATPAR